MGTIGSASHELLSRYRSRMGKIGIPRVVVCGNVRHDKHPLSLTWDSGCSTPDRV